MRKISTNLVARPAYAIVPLKLKTCHKYVCWVFMSNVFHWGWLTIFVAFLQFTLRRITSQSLFATSFTHCWRQCKFIWTLWWSFSWNANNAFFCFILQFPWIKVRDNEVMLERETHWTTNFQFVTSETGTDVTEECALLGAITDEQTICELLQYSWRKQWRRVGR